MQLPVKSFIHTVYLTLILVVNIPQETFTQSVYTSEGKNSIEGFLAISANDEATSYGFGVGFSIAGRGDLGIQYDSIQSKEKLLGYDLSASGFSFSLGGLLAKQSAVIPVSAELQLGFGFFTYKSDALDYLGIDMKAQLLGLGIALHRNIPLSPAFSIQPAVGFAYTRSKVIMEDSYGDSVDDTETDTSFDLDLAFLIGISPVSNIVLTPSLSFSKNTTSFNVSVGCMQEF